MIPRSGRKGKLVIPAIPSASNQRDIARLYEAAGFPVHPWIRTRTKISARGKRRDGSGAEFHFNGPEVIESQDDIDLWADKWQVGFACSWRTGLVAIDVDDPDAFDEWDTDFPESLMVSTGRKGGYHLYLDFRHLRSRVDQASWPVQGDIPGGTLKTNGFTGAPGSRHPNGRLYEVVSGTSVARGSLALLTALGDYRNTRERRESGSGEPGYLAELWNQALAAVENQQHPAIRNLVNGLQKEMSSEAITSVVFPVLLKSLKSYDKRDPWDMNGLTEMLGSARTFVSVEEQRELEAIREVEPNVAGEEGEDWFWNSRPDLVAIRQWAQAQMVSPWALLGEVLAEVIARVPPTFVLPRVIAGYGTLNMLLAITGDSSAGKGGAASVAKMALSIDEPDIDMMRPSRIPVGSGEGLAKNYAFRANGVQQTVAYTAISTAYEVDNLNALVTRSSETITAQLRQFYSGEQLGFGYSNPASRIIIEPFTYRGVLIAGVQPERSGVIVSDHASGFAQRWMFFDAIDPWAPEITPAMPEPLKWSLPNDLYVLDPTASGPQMVADVCDMAKEEIREARKLAVRGKGDKLTGHRLHTQEKFAMGLALLDMRTVLTEDDWKLAAYAMERSDSLQAQCLLALRKQRFAAARVEGQVQGVKEVATEEMKGRESSRKLWQLVLKHIPREGNISYGKLANKFTPERRKDLKDLLGQMSAAKIIISETGTYRGRTALWYSRPKQGEKGGYRIQKGGPK